MWNKPVYEEAVMQYNIASLREEKTCLINGVEYSMDKAKYMLSLFGSQFGYDSTIINDYINLKKT